MPFDAGLLCLISKELNHEFVGSKVEKIFQPERDEIVLNLRSSRGNAKLLVSANANYPRIHRTDAEKENPASPPMFCMLLRKHLVGGVITKISQLSFERVIRIDFQATNEIGDRKEKALILEVLGRQSNILFIGEENRVIDSLKKIDISEKSTRQIIPGIRYSLPDSRNKLNPLTELEKILSYVEAEGREEPLEKALMTAAMGFSPLIAREIAFRAAGDLNSSYTDLSFLQKAGFFGELKSVVNDLREGTGRPYLIKDGNDKVKDFTYIEITQFGSGYSTIEAESFSKLLDQFFSEKDRIESQNQKSTELKKVVSNAIEKIHRKIEYQTKELSDCADRDRFRIYGELLTANLSSVVPGLPFVLLPNYYSETYEELKISLDPSKSPAQNAQLYFKKYQKLKTAEKMLTLQLQRNREEIEYLESVLESLRQAKYIRDFEDIKEELSASGYLKYRRKGKERGKAKPSEPMKYVSSDGFQIYVGRNNIQNDYLTFKIADKTDIWLHTLNIPGSHVILKTNGEVPTDMALGEAAQLAAFYSKASDSSQVPVSYTAVKNVKKPSGAKPGFVIFSNSKTAFVTPKQI